MTLTQVGFVQGLHGAAPSVVRFLSGAGFRVVSYSRTLPLMVVVSGLSVAAIAGLRLVAILAVAFAALGLTRGLLRVASAALVMEEAGETGAGAVGLRTTFLIASVAFPIVYFVLAVAVQRRGGHLHSLHGRAETQQQAA